MPQLYSSYDCILGVPYLQSADLIISFKEKTIKWKNRRQENCQSSTNVALTNEFNVPNVVSSSLLQGNNHSSNRNQRRFIKRYPLQHLTSVVIDSISPNATIEVGDMYYLSTVRESEIITHLVVEICSQVT